MKKEKKRIIAIDSDHILYFVERNFDNNAFGEGNFKQLKKDFKNTIKEYVKICCDYLEWAEEDIELHVCMTSAVSFRAKIYPQYKANRNQEKTQVFLKLQKWARKKYETVEGYEADDLVCYWAREHRAVVVSTDKDVIKGCAGVFYDAYHKNFVVTSEEQANRFFLLQTVMGDSGDNIKGIPRVGEKRAIALLDEFGWDWQGAVKAYEKYGLTKEDCELTSKLVNVNCYEKN